MLPSPASAGPCLAKSDALIPSVGVDLTSPDNVLTAVLAKLPARAAAPVNAPVIAGADGKENPVPAPDNTELIAAVPPPAPVVNELNAAAPPCSALATCVPAPWPSVPMLAVRLFRFVPAGNRLVNDARPCVSWLCAAARPPAACVAGLNTSPTLNPVRPPLAVC